MPSEPEYADFFSDESETPKYWGNKAAGCIFLSKDTGRILLAHRSNEVDYEPETWGTWGGKIDGSETPAQAVEREVEEETGYTDLFKLHPLYVFKDGEFEYHNYLVIVQFEFTPQLNWENDDSAWVEYGNWPKPLHFGMVELINHVGPKLKRIVDLLKKRKHTMLEMDAPPAIHQSADTFSSDFVNYIKHVENGGKTGYRNGLWYPHKSPEGGKPTIGYGHKITSGLEVIRMADGVSDKDVERLLRKDLERARKIAHWDIEHMTKVKIPLDQKQEEIFTDYAFNLGTLRGYPKFVRAVLNKDWTTAGKEYKRSYKNKTGFHELGRNKDFAARYLSHAEPKKKPEPSPEKSETPPKKAINPSLQARVKASLDAGLKPIPIHENIVKQDLGLVDVGIRGYKLQSPYSYVNYGYDAHTKSYILYMVRTEDETNLNQGHAKEVLEAFFKLVKENHGSIKVESYTNAGMAHIQHVLKRMGQQYGVRVYD